MQIAAPQDSAAAESSAHEQRVLDALAAPRRDQPARACASLPGAAPV